MSPLYLSWLFDQWNKAGLVSITRLFSLDLTINIILDITCIGVIYPFDLQLEERGYSYDPLVLLGETMKNLLNLDCIPNESDVLNEY